MPPHDGDAAGDRAIDASIGTIFNVKSKQSDLRNVVIWGVKDTAVHHGSLGQGGLRDGIVLESVAHHTSGEGYQVGFDLEFEVAPVAGGKRRCWFCCCSINKPRTIECVKAAVDAAQPGDLAHEDQVIANTVLRANIGEAFGTKRHQVGRGHQRDVKKKRVQHWNGERRGEGRRRRRGTKR